MLSPATMCLLVSTRTTAAIEGCECERDGVESNGLSVSDCVEVAACAAPHSLLVFVYISTGKVAEAKARLEQIHFEGTLRWLHERPHSYKRDSRQHLQSSKRYNQTSQMSWKYVNA